MMAKQKTVVTDKNYNANRCPKCNSVFTYLRLKLKEFVCRNCGNTWKQSISHE